MPAIFAKYEWGDQAKYQDNSDKNKISKKARRTVALI
jgi:hypothetical protein